MHLGAPVNPEDVLAVAETAFHFYSGMVIAAEAYFVSGR
jgi:hypothetical protein